MQATTSGDKFRFRFFRSVRESDGKYHRIIETYSELPSAYRMAVLSFLYEATCDESNIGNDMSIDELHEASSVRKNQVIFICRYLKRLGYLGQNRTSESYLLTDKGILYYEDELRKKEEQERRGRGLEIAERSSRNGIIAAILASVLTGLFTALANYCFQNPTQVIVQSATPEIKVQPANPVIHVEPAPVQIIQKNSTQ